MEAGKIETTRETQRDIKRYGLLALGILIVGTLVLLLRKRREELG
jgi:LPXTG-motif cell wall-anchored protein